MITLLSAQRFAFTFFVEGFKFQRNRSFEFAKVQTGPWNRAGYFYPCCPSLAPCFGFPWLILLFHWAGMFQQPDISGSNSAWSRRPTRRWSVSDDISPHRYYPPELSSLASGLAMKAVRLLSSFFFFLWEMPKEILGLSSREVLSCVTSLRLSPWPKHTARWFRSSLFWLLVSIELLLHGSLLPLHAVWSSCMSSTPLSTRVYRITFFRFSNVQKKNRREKKMKRRSCHGWASKSSSQAPFRLFEPVLPWFFVRSLSIIRYLSN